MQAVVYVQLIEVWPVCVFGGSARWAAVRGFSKGRWCAKPATTPLANVKARSRKRSLFVSWAHVQVRCPKTKTCKHHQIFGKKLTSQTNKKRKMISSAEMKVVLTVFITSGLWFYFWTLFFSQRVKINRRTQTFCCFVLSELKVDRTTREEMQLIG